MIGHVTHGDRDMQRVKGHSPKEIGLGFCTGPWPRGLASLLYSTWSPSNQHPEFDKDSRDAVRRTMTSCELLNLPVLGPQLQSEGVQSDARSQ